jgi:hypothetical protein
LLKVPPGFTSNVPILSPQNLRIFVVLFTYIRRFISVTQLDCRTLLTHGFFVTAMLRVYCAVRTECWYVIQLKFKEFFFDMAQAVGRQTFSAKARIWSQFNTLDICGGPSGTVTGFSASISVSCCLSFRHWSVMIFIYMLLLTEGRTGEAWKASSFGSR